MIDLPFQVLQLNVAFKRDQEAYKKIFIHFYTPLVLFANNYTGRREASEEIVLDVMMKLWDMNKVLAKVSNLQVYLYTATKNRAINYVTRNKKFATISLEDSELEFDCLLFANDPEHIMLAKEIRQEVSAAVKALPPKCQLVYKLVREDGLSYNEVAQILEISVKTVDRHLNIALHKLVAAVKNTVTA